MQKVMVMRDKLKPLSKLERQKNRLCSGRKSELCARILNSKNCKSAYHQRMLFSLIRNGGAKKWNRRLTLALTFSRPTFGSKHCAHDCCTELNKRILELLLLRSPGLNQVNSHGNSALHYAFAYDVSGDIGEFLIGQGADDTIENVWIESLRWPLSRLTSNGVNVTN